MTKSSPTGIFQEALRRRVFQTAAIYIAGAFVALQVADLAFPGLSIPDSALKYIWVGAMLGFPFVLFFGWRFELADGRILRTAAVNGAPAMPIGKADKLTLSIMSMLLAAICVGMAFEISQLQIDDPGRSRLADAAPNSVAVLPFANFGGVAENEYLADGLTVTLSQALGQAVGLVVTSSNSTLYYKGKDLDVRDIAAELGVSRILEGSVQQSGDRIRIVAQLIEADTGYHLWSNTYEHELGDIFAIQDSIASNVAMAILANLTAAPGLSDIQLTGVSTTNIDAYQKYLQGLEQARIGSNVSMAKAEVLLQQALAIDPGFFEARKELAYNTFELFANGAIRRQSALGRVRPLVGKLLEERPDDGMSIAMDAKIRFWQDPDSIDNDDWVTTLVAAIEREPNETRVYSSLALVLEMLGRHDEAIEWLNRAIIVDPLDYALYWGLTRSLRSLGDSEAAMEAIERGLEINPQWPTGHANLAGIRYSVGDHAGWYQAMRRAVALDPLDPEMEAGLAGGLMGLGLYEQSKRHAATANRNNAGNGGEWSVSSLLSLLGDPSESRTLTESFLRQDLPDRNYGHLLPAWVYVNASIKEGKTQEALAVLEEIFPGVTTVEFEPASTNDFYVQYAATFAWAHGREVRDVVARLDALAPHPLWEWRNFGVATAFLRGNLEEASSLAIEELARQDPWMIIGYRNLYPLSVIAQQPVVAARLAEMEEAIMPGRAAVQAYIAEHEDAR